MEELLLYRSIGSPIVCTSPRPLIPTPLPLMHVAEPPDGLTDSTTGDESCRDHTCAASGPGRGPELAALRRFFGAGSTGRTFLGTVDGMVHGAMSVTLFRGDEPVLSLCTLRGVLADVSASAVAGRFPPVPRGRSDGSRHLSQYTETRKSK